MVKKIYNRLKPCLSGDQSWQRTCIISVCVSLFVSARHLKPYQLPFQVTKVGKEPGLRLKIREEEEWSRTPDNQAVGQVDQDQGGDQGDYHAGDQHDDHQDNRPDLHARLAVVGDVSNSGAVLKNQRQNGRMDSQQSQDTQVGSML